MKLQPFKLEQPVDVSLDQEYYYYYYVGLADGESPEFRDTIFQYPSGFQWTLYVNDGQGSSTNLTFYPVLRDDRSLYIDVFADEGGDFLYIDCQHSFDECTDRQSLNAWTVEWEIDLAIFYV